MRLTILTSIRKGYASRVLPILVRDPEIERVDVVLARTTGLKNWKYWLRKLKKTVRIGPLGAINGIRLRRWYADGEAPELTHVAGELNVRVFETEWINSDPARTFLRETAPDLGLSLGNGYLSASIFSIPRHGMVNLHTERLPQYPGAQGIIWPIYNGERETGLTLHRVTSKIDGGAILFSRQLPIQFQPTLRQTVETTLNSIYEAVPPAVLHLCHNRSQLFQNEIQQSPRSPYTTPTLRQFHRMIRNHRKIWKEVQSDKASRTLS